jgi:hypothetical protein
MAKATLSVLPLVSRAGFRLAGDVDLATAHQFDAALAQLATCGPCDPAACGSSATGDEVHLDLGSLQFIDAAGARTLLRRARSLQGRPLVLHDAPYALRRIIDVLWGQPPGIRMEPS